MPALESQENWERTGEVFSRRHRSLPSVNLIVRPLHSWWCATVVYAGFMVHQSEHDSRDHAMAAAERAADRALRLRRIDSSAHTTA